jgi:prepilin-type N-terminal cleavage/methylation domain-containing protein/prepilin-type processing-associated H-X9-DG protein
MSTNLKSCRRDGSAFTLIELLVVVAIIALLISILMPSLGQARAQARTTVCASRLSQLTKGMLLYADDFSETPPFLGIGFCNLGGGDTPHGPPLNTSELIMAQQEQWLTKNLFPPDATTWDDACRVALAPSWDALVGTADEQRVETGTLYQYTRFPQLYRCPEFERIPTGTAVEYTNSSSIATAKSQNVFNYTRTVLGHKLLSNVQGIADAEASRSLYPGTIMKVSGIFSPAAMYMLFDEQWDFHVAGDYQDQGNLGLLKGYWMGAETINGLIGDCCGSYHGTAGKLIPYDFVLPAKRGNVGYYDGHVELYQDPLPWRSAAPGSQSLNVLGTLLGDFMQTPQGPGVHALDPLLNSLYAQRGIGLTTPEIAALLGL